MLTFDDLIGTQKIILLEMIKNVSEGKHVTLSGPPGSGKTLLTKFLYESLVEMYGEDAIFVAAPTHQAKNVLNETIGKDCAATIHSILKINPETFEDSVEFVQNSMPDFSEARVILCDEASMYGPKLFKILLNTIPSGCSIVAIGDKDQLSPTEESIIDLNQDLEISKFFTSEAFEKLYLTEVIRNADKTIEVALAIRDGGDLYHNVSKDGGVFKTSTVKDFMKAYFKIVKNVKDLDHTRVVAYSNKSVDKFNSIIRRRLYNTTEPYIVGESVILQEPIIKRFTVKGRKKATILYNNGERVVITHIRKDLIQPLYIPTTSHKIDIPYWELTIRSLDNPTTKPEHIKVIIDSSVEKSFIGFMSLYASTCRALRANGSKRVPWPDFWKAKEVFKNIKPLPACTIHKSQGTTNQDTFLYTPCMYTSYELHKDIIKQLKYVGVTRSRRFTFFL